MSVLLVVLIGLPATGKTFLAKSLKDFISKQDANTHVCVVTYDDLLPLKIDVTVNCGADKNVGAADTDGKKLWKSYRRFLQQVITDKLCQLKNLSSSDIYDMAGENDPSCIHSEDEKQVLAKASSSNVFCECFSRQDASSSSTKDHMVFIDDNMFYRSMRYSYYQIARHAQCSYCQIYLKSSVRKSIISNAYRKVHRVTDDVTNGVTDDVTNETIMRMAEQLEEPDPSKHYWEKRTFVMESCLSDIDAVDLAMLHQFLMENIEHVVLPVADESELAARVVDRQICKESLFHQCDQVLRKHVSNVMKSLKDTNRSGNSLQEKAKVLAKQRKSYLKALKEEDISLDFLDADVGLVVDWEDKLIKSFEEYSA